MINNIRKISNARNPASCAIGKGTPTVFTDRKHDKPIPAQFPNGYYQVMLTSFIFVQLLIILSPLLLNSFANSIEASALLRYISFAFT